VIFTVLVVILAVVFLVIQVIQIFNIKDFRKKGTDGFGPMLGILSILTNFVAAWGFGRPYCPAWISGVGMVLSEAVCRLFPALWEACQGLILFCTTIAISAQYFWNGVRSQVDRSCHRISQERCGKVTGSCWKTREISETWKQYSRMEFPGSSPMISGRFLPYVVHLGCVGRPRITMSLYRNFFDFVLFSFNLIFYSVKLILKVRY